MKHKRTLVSDIHYRDDAYPFIFADGRSGAEAALFLVDSEFKNSRNVQILTSLAQVTIQNSRFENLEMKPAFLEFSGGADFRMSNISIV